MKGFGKLMKEMIQARLITKDAKQDLFSFIIDAKDPTTGYAFTADELWAESRLFVLAGTNSYVNTSYMPSSPNAGSDTTATVLVATFFYLSRYPEYYEKIVSSIRNTFPNGNEICSGPKLAQCHYLHVVIDESMRMSPPVGTALWREVCEGGVVVGGELIPAGSDVGCSLYSIFHDE